MANPRTANPGLSQYFQLLGQEVGYQRRKGRYSSPRGYITVSPAHPKLCRLWVSAHLLHPFTLLKLFCMKNSISFLCCPLVALESNPAVWKDLTCCQSHQDSAAKQDEPCSGKGSRPTREGAMTVARRPIIAISYRFGCPSELPY